MSGSASPTRGSSPKSAASMPGTPLNRAGSPESATNMPGTPTPNLATSSSPAVSKSGPSTPIRDNSPEPDANMPGSVSPSGSFSPAGSSSSVRSSSPARTAVPVRTASPPATVPPFRSTTPKGASSLSDSDKDHCSAFIDIIFARLKAKTRNVITRDEVINMLVNKEFNVKVHPKYKKELRDIVVARLKRRNVATLGNPWGPVKDNYKGSIDELINKCGPDHVDSLIVKEELEIMFGYEFTKFANKMNKVILKCISKAQRRARGEEVSDTDEEKTRKRKATDDGPKPEKKQKTKVLDTMSNPLQKATRSLISIRNNAVPVAWNTPQLNTDVLAARKAEKEKRNKQRAAKMDVDEEDEFDELDELFGEPNETRPNYNTDKVQPLHAGGRRRVVQKKTAVNPFFNPVAHQAAVLRDLPTPPRAVITPAASRATFSPVAPPTPVAPAMPAMPAVESASKAQAIKWIDPHDGNITHHLVPLHNSNFTYRNSCNEVKAARGEPVMRKPPVRVPIAKLLQDNEERNAEYPELEVRDDPKYPGLRHIINTDMTVDEKKELQKRNRKRRGWTKAAEARKVNAAAVSRRKNKIERRRAEQARANTYVSDGEDEE